MTTATEMRGQILSKAADDNDFRALLIADPRAAISAEIGTTVPDAFDVVVHEDSATTAHLVLPPSPALTDAELEMATGGANWMTPGAPRNPNTGQPVD